MKIDELLHNYAAGERDFSGVDSDLAPGKLNVYSVTKCKRTYAFKLE